MSGGSMNHLYSKLQQADFEVNTPARAAFAKHLELVAKALHDIEWVDSGDYGPGDEYDAIADCLRSAGAAQKLNDVLAMEDVVMGTLWFRPVGWPKGHAFCVKGRDVHRVPGPRGGTIGISTGIYELAGEWEAVTPDEVLR